MPVFNVQGTDYPDMPKTVQTPQYNPFTQHTPAKPKVTPGWEQLYEGQQQTSKGQELFDIPFEEQATAVGVEEKSPIHYQYKGRYIMTAVKSGLMVIDQNRADIRIRYERYLSQLQTRTADIQQVLFPEVVQFPPSENVVMEKLLPRLAAVGFDLTPLGQGSYAVNGIPGGIEGLDYVRLLRNMVDDATQHGVVNDDELNSSLALSMARHAAIPQGQVLDNQEMENLVNELFVCSNVNYTPDGRPILAILPQHDIEQLLG